MIRLSLPYFILALALFTTVSCKESEDVRSLEKGIVVRITGENSPAKYVKLEAVTNTIVHVTASPSDTFTTAKSLIVLPGLESKTEWKKVETNEHVSLITSS